MLNISDFNNLKKEIILTPNTKEFLKLFNVYVTKISLEKQIEIVKNMAKKYGINLMLKTNIDIISDGEKIITVSGGNVGLTKGGSGDVLAALISSFYTKNNAILSMVLSSYIIKSTSDILFKQKSHCYNTSDLVQLIPNTLNTIINNSQ